jgi:hypothetical protein
MANKATKKRWNSYCVSSLVFALFFWLPLLNNFTSVLAIVFGIVGIKELRANKEEKGKGLAIAAITIAITTVILTIVGIILFPDIFFETYFNSTQS